MANYKAGQGKKKSFRLRFNFWLDIHKHEEELIADKIEVLKNERSFTSVIRDGIRLICDLRDGKLDVLFELFPWVRAEFLQYMREVTREALPEPSAKVEDKHIATERVWLEAEQERLEQERAWEERRLAEAQKALETERRAIKQERQRIEAERAAGQTAMQEQLARMEELLLSQGNQPIERPTLRPVVARGESLPNGSSSPKQLSVPKFSTPAFDDDEEDEDLLTVKRDENAGKRATQNFLKSLMDLTEGTSQSATQ